MVTLDSISRETESVNEDAVSLCEGLDERQLSWRSAPNKWSIAENLIHLRITVETFLPWVDHAISETRRLGYSAEGPFRPSRWAKILVWYVEPPPVIRLPAPRPLRPLLVGSPAGILNDFLLTQSVMTARFDECRRLDINRLRFGSPLASYIRMNLLEMFLVFNGHSRRHLWQASRVRDLVKQGSAADV